MQSTKTVAPPPQPLDPIASYKKEKGDTARLIFDKLIVDPRYIPLKVPAMSTHRVTKREIEKAADKKTMMIYRHSQRLSEKN